MYRLLTLVLVMLFLPQSAYAHTDPPVMSLSLTPDMPDLDEEAKLNITMHGSLTGIATTGANILLEATHLATGESWELKVPETDQGTYEATLRFPQYDMWKMKVSIEHQNELDYREYNIHVMKPIPGYHHSLEDRSELKMDKNAWGQPIPPTELLKWYAIAVIWLLFTVSVIKRKQKPKQKRAFPLREG